MLSKNFIFTALFFGAILFCVSCLENKSENPYKETYTLFPTDSSSFSISLDGIETIKTPKFHLDGKWKIVETTAQETKNLCLTFEGRKIYSTLDFDIFRQKQSKNDYQVFAIYNKCPNEDGIYDKQGDFLVIGSGQETLICYEILLFEPKKIILCDIAKGKELEFKKIGNRE